MVDGGVEVREGRDVDETAWVEVERDLRVAPVDRQATGEHGLDEFLGGVAVGDRVLEGQGELVVSDEGELVGDGAAEVVEVAAAGVDGLPAVEHPEEAVALRAARVGDHEVTELRLGAKVCRGVEAGALHEAAGVIDVEDVLRQTIVSGVVRQVAESDRVVARVEIRQDVLGGVEDLATTEGAVGFAEGGIDEHLGFGHRHDANVVFPGEQAGEDVILGVERRHPVPVIAAKDEVAEGDPEGAHGQESLRDFSHCFVWRVVCDSQRLNLSSVESVEGQRGWKPKAASSARLAGVSPSTVQN